MPLDEYVTPGWSLAYPPSCPTGEQPVKRLPGRLPTGRVYPSWCLAYPPKAAKPSTGSVDAESSDTATQLLRQAFAGQMEIET